jgi:hypothetical protein
MHSTDRSAIFGLKYLIAPRHDESMNGNGAHDFGTVTLRYVPPKEDVRLFERVGRGIRAAVIGRVVPPGQGDALPTFERDELVRFLSEPPTGAETG